MEARFRNASLDTIVPEASNAKLPQALEDIIEVDTDEDTSLLPIKQRNRLFFGMSASIPSLRSSLTHSQASR